MGRFKSSGFMQRFLSSHGAVYNRFTNQRHLISRQKVNIFRAEALVAWNEVITARP
jgi:hypothetical protein